MEKKFIAPELIALCKKLRISLKTRNRISRQNGKRLLRRSGNSQEFLQFRQYEPGDDLRKLDWKVYGRSEKFFTRLYETEQPKSVTLYIDHSKSMNFADRAINSQKLGTGLLYFYHYNHDLIQMLNEEGSALVRSYDQKSRVLSDLSFDSHKPIEKQVQASFAKIPIGSDLIILSDFFANSAQLEKVLQNSVQRKVRPILVQIITPEEEDFTFSEDSVFEDLETKVEISNSPQKVRDQYKENFQQHQKLLKEMSQRLGGEFIIWNTKETLLSIFPKVIQKLEAP